MRIQSLFLHLAFSFLICGFASVLHAEPFKGPWGGHGPKNPSFEKEHNAFNPLRTLVEVHRNHLSLIDGKECPMYPSCSGYSLRCFEKHGLLTGWVMACDRLLHEADEIRKAPLMYVDGKARLYDPVENNDFWWHGEH